MVQKWVRPIKNGVLVYILKNQLAESDEFEIECSSILGRSQRATAVIHVTTGIFLHPNSTFVLNPIGPTKFDMAKLDVSNLDEFSPIIFDSVSSSKFGFIKRTEVNETEDCSTHLGLAL